MIDRLAIVRAQVEVERVCAAAAVAGARVVGTQAVAIVFFALASMPAALEGVGQLHVGVDCNTGLVELAVEGDEVQPACLEPLGGCTSMACVAYRHSRWRLGALG